MPYDNFYNRAIAEKIKSINRNAVINEIQYYNNDEPEYNEFVPDVVHGALNGGFLLPVVGAIAKEVLPDVAEGLYKTSPFYERTPEEEALYRSEVKQHGEDRKSKFQKQWEEIVRKYRGKYDNPEFKRLQKVYSKEVDTGLKGSGMKQDAIDARNIGSGLYGGNSQTEKLQEEINKILSGNVGSGKNEMPKENKKVENEIEIKVVDVQKPKRKQKVEKKVEKVEIKNVTKKKGRPSKMGAGKYKTLPVVEEVKQVVTDEPNKVVAKKSKYKTLPVLEDVDEVAVGMGKSGGVLVDSAQLPGSSFAGGKKPKRAPSAYNRFISEYMNKHNMKMKEAIQDVKNKNLWPPK